MSIYDWVSIALTCFIGAASPGPSLLIIIFIANSKGFLSAAVTAIGHGIGIFIYAILCALGLVYFFTSFPKLLVIIKIFGIVFLLFLGIKMILFKRNNLQKSKELDVNIGRYNDLTLGIITALINPKVILFFGAIFSQFIKSELVFIDKISISILASLIDAFWYIIVAYVSTFTFSKFFGKNMKFLINHLGIMLIVLTFIMIKNSFF